MKLFCVTMILMSLFAYGGKNKSNRVIKSALMIGVVGNLTKKANLFYQKWSYSTVPEECAVDIKQALTPTLEHYKLKNVGDVKIVSEYEAHSPNVFKNNHVSLLYIPDAYLTQDKYLLEGALGHEVGHLVHDHPLKCALISLIFSAAAAYCELLLLSKISLSRAMCGIIALEAAENLSYKALCRHSEREADNHLIALTTNPKILRAVARDLNDDKQHANIFLKKIRNLCSSHPDAEARVKKLNIAAARLEARRLCK